ncbi:MAG: hypothetical protein ACR2L2_02085 [Acidobacteriota bacterium]
MIGSIALNPQWVAMQQGIAANTSAIVTRTQQEISKQIASAFENQQTSGDRSMQAFSKAILGVEDVVDPVTGERLRVESGFEHYWKDYRGKVAGTQSDTPFNADFRKLVIERP